MMDDYQNNKDSSFNARRDYLYGVDTPLTQMGIAYNLMCPEIVLDNSELDQVYQKYITTPQLEEGWNNWLELGANEMPLDLYRQMLQEDPTGFIFFEQFINGQSFPEEYDRDLVLLGATQTFDLYQIVYQSCKGK